MQQLDCCCCCCRAVWVTLCPLCRCVQETTFQADPNSDGHECDARWGTDDQLADSDRNANSTKGNNSSVKCFVTWQQARYHDETDPADLQVDVLAERLSKFALQVSSWSFANALLAGSCLALQLCPLTMLHQPHSICCA